MTWTVAGVLVPGAGFRLAGVTVLACQDLPIVIEILYIRWIFWFSGIWDEYFYLVVVERALQWLPDSPGLAGGISSVVSGFGALASL